MRLQRLCRAWTVARVSGGRVAIALATVCVFSSGALGTSTAQAFPTEGAPLVQNESSVNVTNTQATVVGTVYGEGYSPSFHVEYGMHGFESFSGYYWNVGLKPYSLSVLLSSLQENTTYMYRIVAWSLAGTTYGHIETFHTAGKPAVANLRAVANSAQAVVEAEILFNRSSTEPHGEAEYRYEYCGAGPFVYSCGPIPGILAPPWGLTLPGGWIADPYPSTGGVQVTTYDLANYLPFGNYSIRVQACNHWACTVSSWVRILVP